ncbi:hypothetical protein D1871_15255 [Nakamurella silvestris]|nr:hypothetical protein D1871_15255 [Nakamurella silvestris]
MTADVTPPTAANTDEPVIPPRPGDVPPGEFRLLRPRTWTPAQWALALTLLAFITFIAVRLGPALAGYRVLAAGDLLSTLRPWADGGTKSPVVNGNLSDSINATLPAYLQVYDRISSGSLPLWSNLSGPGQALLVAPTKPVLSLSEFWFLLVPTSYALGLAKLFEVLIAFFGMMLWLRRMGTSWYAGGLAGLLYVGSGFVAAWASWPAQSGVAALLPALFWTIERFLAIRTFRSAMPIAAVVAFLLLGGFPAVAGYAMYAGGAYLVVRLIADRSAHEWAAIGRTFLAAGGAVALGVALAAIQLVPFALGLSDTDLGYRSRQFFAQGNLRSFLSVFYPESVSKGGFVESYSYLGVGTLVLIGIAVFTPRVRGLARGATLYLFAGLLFAVVLVWQQGWYTDWVGELPIFSGNNTGRVRAMIGLFACALAGLGIHRIFAEKPGKRAFQLMAVLAGGGVLVTALIHWHYGRGYEFNSRSNFTADVVWGSATVVVILLAVLLASRRSLRYTTFALLVALIAVQTGNSVANYWPMSKPEQFYPDLAITDSIKEHIGDDRLNAPSGFMGSAAAAYGIRSLQAHNFQPTPWSQMIKAIYPSAYKGTGRSATIPFVGTDLVPTPQQASLLDRFAINIQYSREDTVPPGTRVNVAGNPVGDGPPSSTGSTAVAAGQPIRTTFATVPVRAAQITFGTRMANPDGVMVRADVVDATTGEVLATGAYQRRAIDPGTIIIPIAGEEVADHVGQLALEITTSEPATYHVTEDGQLAAKLIAADDDGVHIFFADERGSLWKRDSALSRIRWADAAEVIPEGADRLERLADPTLPDTTVVLDEPGPVPSGTGPATLSVVADGGDRIAVDVTAADSGYLVVADWMRGGWQVRIDDRPATLVPADHAFGGTFVPAGQHRVTFEYVGKKLGVGILITALALLVLIGVLGWPAVRRRRALRSTAQAPMPALVDGPGDAGALTDGVGPVDPDRPEPTEPLGQGEPPDPGEPPATGEPPGGPRTPG